jgi:hypothetical protein
MKKRLIDIRPPKDISETPGNALRENETMPSQEGGLQGRMHRAPSILLSVLLATLLITPVVSHFFLRNASIDIWPYMTTLRVQESIAAQIGYDSVNFERKLIRARVFEEEVAQTTLFPSTGKQFVEEAARGTIRIYNENVGSSQALIASTRLISEDGKIFRLEQAVSVPGATTNGPGYIDATVVAMETGEEYNIGPSKFSLPGLVGSPLYTRIYGESLSRMAGGMQREVAVVTEDDITAAQNELAELLKVEAVRLLLAKVPTQFEILSDSLQTSLTADNSLVRAGATLEEFTYAAAIKVEMVGFHKEDANLLVHHLLAAQLSDNEALHESTLQISYRVKGNVSDSGVVPIDVDMVVNRYEQVDEAQLANRLRGASAQQFSQLLAEYPFLAQTRISIWPFWASRLPENPNNISLNVRLEG